MQHLSKKLSESLEKLNESIKKVDFTKELKLLKIDNYKREAKDILKKVNNLIVSGNVSKFHVTSQIDTLTKFDGVVDYLVGKIKSKDVEDWEKHEYMETLHSTLQEIGSLVDWVARLEGRD